MLTAEAVERVTEELKAGGSIREVSRRTGVSRGAVKAIAEGRHGVQNADSFTPKHEVASVYEEAEAYRPRQVTVPRYTPREIELALASFKRNQAIARLSAK